MDKLQFEQHIKGKIVLADFSAPWCAPCRAMVPVIKELERLYHSRATVIQINIDTEKKLATDYMVHSIPTLILFKNGKEKQRLVGLQLRSVIEQGLNSLL